MRLSSPIYWSPFLYRLVMRLLYGRVLDDRYRVINALIPTRSSVVELCCGCGYLYEYHLRSRDVRYHGIDLLASMIGRLKKLGASAEQGNVLTAVLPPSDYAIMLGSLYHFHPEESRVIEKMAEHGTGILLEPVANLSQSSNSIVRNLAHAASYIHGTSSSYRMTEERLDEVLRKTGVQVLRNERVLDGKYQLVIFRKAVAGS